MFLTKVAEKIKTHISWRVPSFRKSRQLWDNVKKLGGVRNHSDITVCAYALYAWLARLHAHAHAPGHSHTQACIQASANKHRQVRNTFSFTQQKMNCKRASVVRCKYIASLVWFLNDTLNPKHCRHWQSYACIDNARSETRKALCSTAA